MELKPGYKRSDVGIIPEEWSSLTIADLEKQGFVRLGRGNVISKRHIASCHGDFPIYSSSVQDQGLFGCYGRYMFDEELITWSIDGGGHFFHRPRHRFSVTNVCGYMRADTSRIDYRFLAAQLQHLRSRKSFDYLSKAHPSVIRGEYTVPLPDLPEQRAIAGALSDVDALLDGLDRLMAKKRDLKQASIQQLLTGESRLPGFHEKRKVMRLDDIAAILKGSGLSKSQTTSFGARPCILYGELFTTYGCVISDVVGRTDSPEGRPSKLGDVLLPSSTTTTGIDLAKASALLMDDVALGGDIIILRQKSDSYDPVFLANYLTHARKHEIAELAQGITIHHLYGRDLKRISLELPSPDEQTAVAAVLSDLDAELSTLEARREKTRALKQAMMQELLTGRTRLV